ncbi:MAG TPA: hypothetical protein DEZ08_06340 [Dehalococcoidia bacterium]|jgi:catechol 2,3-dioxygenase-like lactoylglutathione lyase family enzyme|nr:hypothetical protein [Dehalococcoidia bacterium]|tara:strand:- start:15 stop:407 length:393 start_codon:yes stop_codon:yes gene_type:complete
MAKLRVNHIHLRAPNPEESAKWYVDNFGLKIQGRANGLGGTDTVRLEVDNLTINITSAPNQEDIPEGTTESHFGLEHFGFHTDDIATMMKDLESKGVKVLLPITDSPSGNRISYVEGPDNVMIELVQPLS